MRFRNLICAAFLLFIVSSACGGRRSGGPARDCPLAQSLCNGEPCACGASDSVCQNRPGRPICASDVNSVCCEGVCRYAPVPGEAGALRCPCIVGTTRSCTGGVETCIDDNPGAAGADDERSKWGACVGVPVDVTWFHDDDGDGFCGQSKAAPMSPGPGWVTGCPTEPMQCEGNAAVHSVNPEVCGNGVDDDCSGGDRPCLPPPIIFYLDPDGDGYCGWGGYLWLWLIGCRREPVGCENNAARNPGKAEICGNGVDEDCSGGDIACWLPPIVIFFLDPDRDGYCGVPQGFSLWWRLGCRPEPGSCENNAARNPGKAEICGNGVDEDCKNGDKPCPTECPAIRPVKCECSDGFVSDCMTRNACNNHHPHCGIGNHGVPRTEGCWCEAR